jgi:hypothetical protein
MRPDTRPNNAMHADSAITIRFESAITGAEPVMANRSAKEMALSETSADRVCDGLSLMPERCDQCVPKELE